MKQTYTPRNEFGLALPPARVEFDPEPIQETAPETRRCFVSRHHLYWPRAEYLADPLKHEFREHRFNSIWLDDRQHRAIHIGYLGTRSPKPEIMHAFLDEAKILDDLGVCVRAIEMINEAIYEGRVAPEWLDHTKETRNKKCQQIADAIIRPIEVVPGRISIPILNRAAEIITL